ncbi:MAG: FtsX-like permease family protein [Dysgonamonadaceae bacterium]|jgi:putative ABC transport system permease protein|nr:FtsX-like permease family protein [Dysgonamonadaceae bacterium]MDD3309985.1 FtsX-like permease family protein [Dysgonamonadaceae bacterium]MDD3901222.1 FtsX-like permease family protein [Dysgonamonadaceae bacterium]MDD4400005.1 FtsX-like permease family protein [Dysgonamonadaceae bacterium]MEA5081512.1 FtsX-like permease family protein [Dysgonamonadaceae bacterium]
MFDFIYKGIIRDKKRSLLPIIVVTIGVFVVVFSDGIIGGMINNMISMTANFQTGHVKVMTRAYAKQENEKPIDLSILNAGELINQLKKDYPIVDWTPRIMFGGLLDIPDQKGETKAQGPVSGISVDFLTTGSNELKRLGIKKAIIDGTPINRPGQILVSVDFAEKYNVKPGDIVTFFGSTMYGSMTFSNFTIAGIVRFGNSMLDRGAIMIDISDARLLLDMDNAAAEIVGFLPEGKYNNEKAEEIKKSFNDKWTNNKDEYAPIMTQLMDQEMMSATLGYAKRMSLIMIVLLIIALAIVLWNAGILGGIRRYNEFGIRLAMGEEKKHIFNSLMIESLIIGIIGSILGTTLGFMACLILSRHGIDYSAVMRNVSLMMDPVIRTTITPRMLYSGTIPGIISILVGTALAGQAIYKRNTAMLFKELD